MVGVYLSKTVIVFKDVCSPLAAMRTAIGHQDRMRPGVNQCEAECFWQLIYWIISMILKGVWPTITADLAGNHADIFSYWTVDQNWYYVVSTPCECEATLHGIDAVFKWLYSVHVKN